ncbi:poly-beta-1,6-N-acetyl-D-glucosamine N-deacetylase PgaB [uncultured Halomonas sp.]|uniref:poly-beta-1,6-N-acetyl-D-glucosamine N-deacetylase PgaB n=1 Tax=uncultured Halomonas sp. TaxID=173971 RepID=UPI0026048F9E|nr:poly-beta-1,6-N-acetyl-D-glucosamine N-deacetylase PgaB [uncultured Halomonas sp.]
MTRLLLNALLILMGAGLISTASAERQPNDFVVISYHDIVDETSPGERHYFPQTITRDRLIEHFNLIKAYGYQPISFQQLLDAESGIRPLPDRAVMLTFDDGYRSFHDIVYPLLKLYDFPAVAAVVGSWLDAEAGSEVPYGDTAIPREQFLSWPQMKELHADPLVEIASHTYDMHHGIIGNPQGNEQAAAVTSRWLGDRYESEGEYLERLHRDMEQASRQLQERLGEGPRLMIWPYGAYSEATLDIAAQYGMRHSFSLLSQPNIVGINSRAMGRYLVDQETSLQTFKEILSNRTWERDDLRVVHVDLDYVYDPDPVQQERNLDALVDRIYRFGITTVYLQAFADQDGTGVAEALYFENRHLPVKADLFNRVAWQLKKRANVKVYAWMPVLAFDLGGEYVYVTDTRTNAIAEEHYLRLSPYVTRNREVILEIYEDLGRHAKFDGLLFHDDAFLTDYEDAGKAAMDWYQNQWSMPSDIFSIRRSPELFERWAGDKTEFLTHFTLTLAEAANRYRQADNMTFTTSRNLYAIILMEPSSKRWLSQSPESFAGAYDYVAVMAMPYMEGADDAGNWLKELARRALAQVPAEQLIFELQSRDWRDQSPIPDAVLIDWIDRVRDAGIRHIGYYPDDFLSNHPDTSRIGPHFSLGRRFGVKR